ncbi:peptidase S8 [Arthrobacter echini]|uniref:Peptidase S8 n=1 Tax=Arthrobacter echini TaxID=1529066 RepID=A0A4S5E8F1_9MICC|nr:S8 family serine peptidase [Arthrobacter echini]THJ67908.1 peptidase S8 [Arthrobacter echini]
MRSRALLALRTAGVLTGSLALLLPTALPAAADDVRGDQYWLGEYGITEAWASTRGEGVTVAVIDSGVDGSQQDLTGAVVGGTDVSGAGGPAGELGIGEVPSHGTLVSTLLAGRGHTAGQAPGALPAPDPEPGRPGVTEQGPGAYGQYGRGPDGVVGVAPEADLLAVSVWVDGPTSGPNPAGIPVEEQIPEAVTWAVDHGADVINISIGSTSTEWPESWDEAFLHAEENDVVIVAAAGNRAGGLSQVGAPATIPGVLAVAGLDRSGTASAGASSEGISIGVAAPSENLVGGMPGGLYADWSGTSGSAPLVAGVAALVRARHPGLSAAEVVNRILDTARDAGPPGFDTLYGYGVLDAAAAVEEDLEVPAENRLGSMAEWIHLYRRADHPDPPAPIQPEQAPPPTATVTPPPAPTATEPFGSSRALGAVVVLGSGGVLLLALVTGTVHVLRVRRRTTSAGTPEPGPGTADTPR